MNECPVCEHHGFKQTGKLYRIEAKPRDKNINKFGWCPTCGALFTDENNVIHVTVPKHLQWQDMDEGYLEETLKA